MKIFLSYGHNDHVKLVDAVFDALVEAGHTPWKDDRYEGESGIAPGEDFVKVIYDAIDDCDFVIAFVTASTTEKRFCCDERQYAYNKKGSKFIQIRLDGAEIRLGNSLSYIDMGDVEEANGEINQVMFKDKMKSLFYAFRDPASFAEGGFTPWAKFEAHLKVDGVMKYRDFLSMPEKDDFVGREWLCEKCKSWVVDDTIACRLFVILGEAGSGKTAFVRHLAADRSLVKSVHVCIYDRPSTRTARDTLKDLAYILAENNQSYFNFLKNKSFDKLIDMSIDGLFEFLFIDPLKNETEKYLLVIDGLDELDEENGLTPLFKVFRQYATRINPNISFLLTGRPDENILNKLRTVNGYKSAGQVMLDKTTSEQDLSRYIEAKLNEMGCYSENLAQTLLEACDGNFEYLSLTFKEAQEEGLLLSEKMTMPQGLYQRYTQYIDRRMEVNGQAARFTKEQRLLLGVICVAYEPVPLSLLAEIVDMDEYDVEDELAIFGSLIRKNIAENGEVYISLFTKSLKDYFVEKVNRNYGVNVDSGLKTVAEYILGNCKTIKDFSKYTYIKVNGCRHLLEYARDNESEVKDFIIQLWQEDEDLISARLAFALSKGDAETAEKFCGMYASAYKNDIVGLHKSVVDSLKQRRDNDTLLRVISALNCVGEKDKSWILEADLLRMNPTPQNLTQAEELFMRAYRVREDNYRNNPSYQTKYALMVICDRLGNAAKSKNTPDGMLEAEEWYKKTYELDEQIFLEKPTIGNKRNFALSCRRMGDVARAKNNFEEIEKAQAWYEKALKLDIEDYQEKPCYDYRWALVIDYERLGDIAKIKNTSESINEALSHYQKACEYAEQNYHDNPCYQSRKTLVVAYDKKGLLLKKIGTPEAMTQAEELFEKECELDEQNYRENPCYESRRGLSITYGSLGNVSKSKGTPGDLGQALEWHKKACELDEQNYRENPCQQSRNDLRITYVRLVEICRAIGTPEAFEELEKYKHKKEILDGIRDIVKKIK